jgi:O-methyltransferase
MLKPLTAFFNKDYKERQDGSFFLKLQKSILEVLTRAGDPPAHTFYADDCMVIFRNLGFLTDSDFERAFEQSSPDATHYARLWRIWILSWSLRQRWGSAGLVVDCGTYNGAAIHVALKYAVNCKSFGANKVFLFDLFDNPPIESKKSDHGPNLYATVKRRFDWYPGVSVVQGELPKALDYIADQNITWCHIDLNSEIADCGVFERIYPNLNNGAIVIFDDYGFSRYKKTQLALDGFLKKNSNSRILELPTGQGLYIHGS